MPNGPALQTTYRLYPDEGFPGLVARPEEPCIIERGLLGGSAAARPGAGLYWDRANSRWKIPDAGTEDHEVQGILTYDQSKIQESDDSVSFAVGDEIQVGILGTFFMTAGVALRKFDRVIYDASAHDWNRRATFAANTQGTPTVGQVDTAIENLVSGAVEGGLAGSLIVCASDSVAAGGLFHGRISFSIGNNIVYT